MSVSTLRFHPSPSSHAQARERFAASDDLERRLKSVVRGEVRFDNGTRALYATDSSNYRQVPIGLVVPIDEADVQATIQACREFGMAFMGAFRARWFGSKACGTTPSEAGAA